MVDERSCPYCKEAIKADAIVCPHCTTSLVLTQNTPPGIMSIGVGSLVMLVGQIIGGWVGYGLLGAGFLLAWRGGSHMGSSGSPQTKAVVGLLFAGLACAAVVFASQALRVW